MGIDIEQFVHPVDDELICTLCQDVFEVPTQTPICEHIFCQKCIHQWLQEYANQIQS
jgi:hypothetical protein